MPIKQISKSTNSSPAHRAYPKKTETDGLQGNHSSKPASPEDEHKPAANGVLAQMERHKDKEDSQEENSDSVRTETTGLLNGDMGSSEQSEGLSPPHTDRTVTQTENKDSGTETEHKNEEGGTEQKVRLLCG